MDTFLALRDQVGVQMEAGVSFGQVEDDIDSANLSDDLKAALWLFAWSYLPQHTQRREAIAISGQVLEGFAS